MAISLKQLLVYAEQREEQGSGCSLTQAILHRSVAMGNCMLCAWFLFL
jgi:hypothetical protein